MSEKIIISPEDVKPTVASPPQTMTPQFDGWTIGVVASTALVVLVGGVLYFSAGDTVRAGGVPPTKVVSPAARATLAYWKEIGSITSELKATTGSGGDSIENVRKALGVAGAQLTQLPVMHVDEEAVEVASRVVDAFGEFKLVIESFARLKADAEALGAHANSFNVMFESFIRGAMGDPLGTTARIEENLGNLTEREQKLLGQKEAVLLQFSELPGFANRIRAVLTRRHGVDFPAISFE